MIDNYFFVVFNNLDTVYVNLPLNKINCINKL